MAVSVNPIPDQEVFTTGEVARITGLGQCRVVGLIDRGVIGGYRLPGCVQRRVTRESLLAYLSTAVVRLRAWRGTMRPRYEPAEIHAQMKTKQGEQ